MLIAEDDEISYRLIKAILKNTSVNLLRAYTGKTAVELVLEHPEISLVLMDLKMPVMNGLEAAKEIKSFRQNLPIIAVTAHAETGAEHLALSSGCDGYITKPFEKDELMALIQKWIGIIKC
ncbi:MAG: response regulator [Ignavibacteriae bacterium]|nr:response regulator [Ignavibacteriota bacterium]